MRYMIFPGLVGSVEHGWTLWYPRDVDTYAIVPGCESDVRAEVPENVKRYFPHAIEVTNDRGAWVPVTSAVLS